MKQTTLFSRLNFATIILIFALVLPMAQVKAENGQAFSISPPLLELKGDPGQTVTASIKLTNVSADELLMKSQFNDFAAKNETGEPNIIFDESDSTTYSLRHWIGAPEPFKIAAQQTKTVEFPITIPRDAEPGGHYAVIRFTGTTPDLEQSGVALTASIGTLVLLQVSGTIDDNSTVADFFTATPKFAATGFFENSPITFVQRIKNSGNVHVKPTGTIEIFDSFGQRVSTLRVNGDPSEAANPPKSILPNSTRRFNQTWNTGWAFGRYQANLQVSYGQNGKTLTSSVTFWVIPYKLILLTLAGATIIFFALRFGIKKYNAHIIAKAGGDKPKPGLRLKR